MIQKSAKEISEERGFNLEELKPPKPAPPKVTAQEGRKQLIQAINKGDIVDTAAAEQFLIDRGVPPSNARYIVNELKVKK